jgi:hypothetical protein
VAALDGPESARIAADLWPEPDEHPTVAEATPTTSAAAAILFPNRRDPI